MFSLSCVRDRRDVQPRRGTGSSASWRNRAARSGGDRAESCACALPRRSREALEALAKLARTNTKPAWTDGGLGPQTRASRCGLDRLLPRAAPPRTRLEHDCDAQAEEGIARGAGDATPAVGARAAATGRADALCGGLAGQGWPLRAVLSRLAGCAAAAARGCVPRLHKMGASTDYRSAHLKRIARVSEDFTWISLDLGASKPTPAPHVHIRRRWLGSGHHGAFGAERREAPAHNYVPSHGAALRLLVIPPASRHPSLQDAGAVPSTRRGMCMCFAAWWQPGRVRRDVPHQQRAVMCAPRVTRARRAPRRPPPPLVCAAPNTHNETTLRNAGHTHSCSHGVGGCAGERRSRGATQASFAGRSPPAVDSQVSDAGAALRACTRTA